MDWSKRKNDESVNEEGSNVDDPSVDFTNEEERQTEEKINIESEDEHVKFNQNPHVNEGDLNFDQVRERRNRSRHKTLEDCKVKLHPSIDHSQPAPSQEHATLYPLANFVSYEKFSKSHKSFLAAITSNDEPNYFNQVVQDPN